MIFLFLEDIVTYGTFINRILKKTQITLGNFMKRFFEKHTKQQIAVAKL